MAIICHLWQGEDNIEVIFLTVFVHAIFFYMSWSWMDVLLVHASDGAYGASIFTTVDKYNLYVSLLSIVLANHICVHFLRPLF